MNDYLPWVVFGVPTLGGIATWLFDRRKRLASTTVEEANAAKINTDAAIALVGPMTARLEHLETLIVEHQSRIEQLENAAIKKHARIVRLETQVRDLGHEPIQ